MKPYEQQFPLYSRLLFMTICDKDSQIIRSDRLNSVFAIEIVCSYLRNQLNINFLRFSDKKMRDPLIIAMEKCCEKNELRPISLGSCVNASNECKILRIRMLLSNTQFYVYFNAENRISYACKFGKIHAWYLVFATIRATCLSSSYDALSSR